MGTMAEVQEGEEARPGIPILDVVDPSAMRVRVNANQADVEGLQRGQSVRITLDSYPVAAVQWTARNAVAHRHHEQHVQPRAHVRGDLLVEGADAHLLPDLAAAIDISPARP